MSDGVFPTEKGEGISDNKTLILCLAACIIPMLLLALLWPYNPGDRARVEQLRRFAADVPVHPDFKELTWYGGVKSDHAYLTVKYDIPAYSPGFEAVKKFYTEALTRQGWSFVGEEDGLDRSVSFRKGRYSISIYYHDGGHSDWDYSVSYGWSY